MSGKQGTPNDAVTPTRKPGGHKRVDFARTVSVRPCRKLRVELDSYVAHRRLYRLKCASCRPICSPTSSTTDVLPGPATQQGVILIRVANAPGGRRGRGRGGGKRRGGGGGARGARREQEEEEEEEEEKEEEEEEEKEEEEEEEEEEEQKEEEARRRSGRG